MEETIGQSAQPFRMDTLLAEMREIGNGRDRPGQVVRSPPVSQLASEEDARIWAQQYLDAGKMFQVLQVLLRNSRIVLLRVE